MPRYDLKAYTSLTARIPQDLADQVKRYALEHRCGLSELIRDGLEMRLEADTPWHAQGAPVRRMPRSYRRSYICLRPCSPRCACSSRRRSKRRYQRSYRRFTTSLQRRAG